MTLLILFGLPGTGKNFTGRVLRDDFGFAFHDGDDDLPPEMLAAIQRKEIVTDAMRDAHTANIIKTTARLKTANPRMVAAAAFFKRRNRQQVLDALPDAHFIRVDADLSVRNARLSKRRNHSGTLAYAQKIEAEFEPEGVVHHVIVNNTTADDLRAQLRQVVAVIHKRA